MPSGLFIWSQTANNNGSSDTTINYLEGQAPSSVNDSARAMMAVLKKHDDDISGAIVTGGTSTSYTVASYSVFDSLAHMANQMIAFTPHATNGATVTLNVDGLGAKPLRAQPSVELPAGSLILGTPYVATYNNSDAAWYLQGGSGIANAYSIPLGSGLDYWGSTTPNSIFAFPAGQAISRSTYATLFTLFSTTYGSGDGSTTFNLPDKTGRTSVMKEASATRLTTAGGGVDGATIGAVGGTQNVTLLTANLPPYTPAGTIADGPIAIGGGIYGGTGHSVQSGSSVDVPTNAALITASQSGSTFTGTAQGGTSTAVKIVQPTIICNYILRII